MKEDNLKETIRILIKDEDSLDKKIEIIKETLKDLSFGYNSTYIIKNKLKDKDQKIVTENFIKLARAYEHVTNIALMESVDEMYRGLVGELFRSMSKEHNCKTETELALVELIVHSYIRVLDGSRRINNEFNAGTISLNRTAYIAQLSKLIDRSHRQMIQSIQTLNSLKNVTTKITINADTAFIANNQQLNNTNEINDAK